MLAGIRIVSLIITSAVLIAGDVIICYGQTTAFGIRLTPSLVSSVAVDNPSPSNIYGPHELNLNIGVYALRYFKGSRMGVKAGLEYGGVPFNVGIDAPRSAFGTGAGGDSQISSLYSTNDFNYKALNLSVAYKIPIKDKFIEIAAGPTVRNYGYDSEGYDAMIFAFNRNTPVRLR